MIRQIFFAVLLVASLSCACYGADRARLGDDCSAEESCTSCVVCHVSFIAQDQPAAEQILIARFILPVSDFPPTSSFVDVPFQPPRV